MYLFISLTSVIGRGRRKTNEIGRGMKEASLRGQKVEKD